MQRVAVEGGTDIAGLIWRCHGVDGIAVRRDGAVVHIFRLAVQRGGGAVGRDRQAHALRAVGQHGDLFLRRRFGCIEIFVGAARDEELVVHVGAAEGRHEEVVAQRVLLGDLPQVQVFRRFAVVAHHQAAAVGPCGKAVVLAAVDLHLVVIEAVHEVARDHRLRQVQRAIGIVDLERLVGQVGRLRLRDDGALAGRRHAAPGGWQHGQGAAVDVFLWHIGGA
ncbi:hypothetical protein D3C72_1187580 [compost metagenome]